MGSKADEGRRGPDDAGRVHGNQPRDGAQSVRRSLTLLQILSQAPAGGFGLAEIARRGGLSPPTAHRMLKVLAAFGAVEQRSGSRRYVIGDQVPVWAAARPPHLRLIDVTRPFLDRAGRTIGVTTFLSYRTELDATCIAHMSNAGLAVPLVPIGSRRPLGMPACSWAMLAELPEDEADSIILRNRDRLHRHGMEPAEAHRLLRETRRRGFAFREQGRVTGLLTVSLAIRPLRPFQLATMTVTQRPERSWQCWVDKAARFLHECCDEMDRSLKSHALLH